MQRSLRRALAGLVAAGLVIVLGATPVPAGVGTRLVNGDGDTRNECLSIADTGRGAAVEMSRCTTNAHHGWELRHIGGEMFRIVSQDGDARGRCLTGHGEGRQVTMDPCNSDGSQYWVLRAASGDWFQIWSGVWGTEQCLDVKDNGRSNVVQTWLCGPSNKGNQLWKWW